DSAAGSANDSTSRVLGDRLSKVWNQPVVTLNQPGAGGGISAKVASQSPADGYTLYMPSTSVFLAVPGGPGVPPNLPVELPRDFESVSYILEQPLYIGASHKSGINSMADVIRGLASTALKRPPGFENLPTVAETVPDFFVGAWTILLAPKGTPEATLRKIHNDMRIVLDDPEIRAKLALNGGYVRHMTPQE